MNLYRTAGPTDEPVTLDEAKERLKVVYTEEDQYIFGLIVAAREWGESLTGRAFLTQSWELKLPWFPPDGIELPKPPTVSVTSVKYLDTSGTVKTMGVGEYLVTGLGAEIARARIEPAYGTCWPSTLAVSDAVRVVFVAGYGAATSLPRGIKNALLAHVAEAFTNRERPDFSAAEAGLWQGGFVDARFD